MVLSFASSHGFLMISFMTVLIVLIVPVVSVEPVVSDEFVLSNELMG